MPRLILKSDDRVMHEDGVDTEATIGRTTQRRAIRARLREARASRETTAAAKAARAARPRTSDSHPHVA